MSARRGGDKFGLAPQVGKGSAVGVRQAYLDGHNFDVYARGLCEALGLDVARSAAA